MIKNYLKTAWRNLVRNKSYTAINIIGLAVGIAACLLIFLVIHFETSFDNFHKKRDRIYRVVTASKTPEGMSYETGVPLPVSEAMRIDYPQIPVASILKNESQVTVEGSNGQPLKKFKEENVYFAEPQFFNIFDFDWLAGDQKTALTEPNSAVLTQETAEKYFGDWRVAIGKTIKYENKNIIKVTGILKNVPVNTDFKLGVVISHATLNNTNFKGNLKDWVSTFSYHYCFIVLPGSITVNQFNNNLAAFVKKHKPAEYVKQGLIAVPLTDMHYDSRFGVFSGHTFSRELISALSLIGLFLLIIACVNFINLATAQAVNRSKEVGIRKVLGSNRAQLVFQFISETFIITFFAVILAIGLAQVALPFLNQLLDVKISSGFMIDPVVLSFLIIVILVVTLLSGFYPAMVLSGFNPITALKNKVAAGRSSGISLRRGLVVLQFCIAQVLVIGTLVVITQMNYLKNYSLGFDKEAIVNVNVPSDSVSHLKIDALRNQLLQQPGIKSVSFSFASPSDNNGWGTDFKFNNSPKRTDFGASLKWSDAEYFKLYGLRFIAGRPFIKSDQVREYVVNETLVKKLGIHDPKDIIGKSINLWDDKSKFARVVGVVKDFNIASLRQPIPPVLMASWKDVYQTINIKLQTGKINQTLTSIQRLWNSTFPDYVYDRQFLDEKVAGFYDRETQLSTLYKIFAGIAIFISCLGLYGLVSFMAVQRTKEVGIRKTLGATVSHIVYLFSKEFTLLILVAFAISAPVGWYFMNKWLQAFTYKISLGPGIFILAIAASVIIAWLTVGYKAIRAALANPVNSLRSE
ncbi:MAG: FtsX-like permease family protein [Mucilaginibacter sp.]|nr:FtsX-like permease family protein [Mucilaginibacter sp.]